MLVREERRVNGGSGGNDDAFKVVTLEIIQFRKYPGKSRIGFSFLVGLNEALKHLG
jgi:hypothetical protein